MLLQLRVDIYKIKIKRFCNLENKNVTFASLN